MLLMEPVPGLFGEVNILGDVRVNKAQNASLCCLHTWTENLGPILRSQSAIGT